MIKAIIFDFFGVVETGGAVNRPLLDFISDQLKPKYKIAMVSNSSGNGARQMLGDDLDLFDVLVFSGVEGVAKPQPDIFELAANRLGLDPSECVFVDDSAMHVNGAKAAGMQAIVYQNFDQFKTDLNQILSTRSNN